MKGINEQLIKTLTKKLCWSIKCKIFSEFRLFGYWILGLNYRCMECIRRRTYLHSHRTLFFCSQRSIFTQQRVFSVWVLRLYYWCVESIEWKMHQNLNRTLFYSMKCRIFAEWRVFGVWILGSYYWCVEVSSGERLKILKGNSSDIWVLYFFLNG